MLFLITVLINTVLVDLIRITNILHLFLSCCRGWKYERIGAEKKLTLLSLSSEIALQLRRSTFPFIDLILIITECDGYFYFF